MKYVNDNGLFTGTIVIPGDLIDTDVLSGIEFHANITNGGLDEGSVHAIDSNVEDRWLDEIANYITQGELEFTTVNEDVVWGEAEDDSDVPHELVSNSMMEILEDEYGDLDGLENL